MALSVGLAACSDDDGAPVLELAERGPGTCLDADPEMGPEVTSIPVVDCTTEHTHEIYAVVAYTDADVFPGIDALDGFAERSCVAAFQPYVGVSVFDSELTFSWLVPTLTSWNNDDDRDVICVATRFDGAPLTVSVKGFGR